MRSTFSRILSRRSLSRFGLEARNLFTTASACSLRWPAIKAESQLLTKNILRLRLRFGSSASDRSRYGRVRSDCLSVLKGTIADSIQLSLISLLFTKSFQYFALFSAVPKAARAA